MGYHQLTRDERCQIYALKSTGKKQNEIAAHLGVSASTICRELERNSGRRGYRHKQANEKAVQKRHDANCQPNKMTPTVINFIEEKLIEKWSPEQIAGVLRSNKIFISHETIYRHIWKNKTEGGSLYKHLRHRGKKYNHRGAKTAGRGCIPNRVDISQRPKIIEKKSRLARIFHDT